jgi:hypothetical protein
VSAAGAQGTIDWHPSGDQGNLHGAAGVVWAGATFCVVAAARFSWPDVIPIAVMTSEPASVLHANPLVTRTKAARTRLVRAPTRREGRCIILTIC